MSNPAKTGTLTILRRMKAASSAQSFVRANEHNFIDEDFVSYLNERLAQLGKPREQVFRDVDMDSSYGHQIFKARKNPRRDNVLKLAIGLNANDEEAQRMLLLAKRRGLHPRIKRDAVLMMALERHESFRNIQETLFELGLPPLGDEPD